MMCCTAYARPRSLGTIDADVLSQTKTGCLEIPFIGEQAPSEGNQAASGEPPRSRGQLRHLMEQARARWLSTEGQAPGLAGI
jgi:hypothetical protein